MDKYRFNQLLEKIRTGDNNALEPIYREYYGKLTYSAMQILRNYSEATDIASEIFLHILKSADSIGYIKYPDAWMRQLAKNFAIDYVRHNSMLILTEDLPIRPDPPLYENTALHLEISNEVRKLSAHKQDLFELHYIYGYKYKEISRMLDIPVGTIKRQFHEIKTELQNLKKYL